MKKFLLASTIVLAALFPGQQALGLTYGEVANYEKVLGQQAYPTVTLFSASNLTLSYTPYDYDPNSGKWNYRINWQRMPNRSGSIYINGNAFVSEASGTGEAYTGYSLNPDSRYRLTYYSNSNGRGVRIVNRYFRTLPAEESEDEEEEEHPVQAIAMIYPQVAGQWLRGQTKTISWTTSSPNISRITLRLSGYEGGPNSLYQVELNNNPGQYNFTVPANFPLGYAKFYVINRDDEQTFAMPEGYFTIAAASTTDPAIKVLSPNGGETFTTGQTYTIRWQAPYNANSDYATVVLSLLRGNSCISSSEGDYNLCGQMVKMYAYQEYDNIRVPNTGSYTWNISTRIPSGNDYYIAVGTHGIGNPSPGPHYIKVDSSDRPFSIIGSSGPGQIVPSDSDNSPDYTVSSPYSNFTPQSHPDLFVKGVAKGTYLGSSDPNIHAIFGVEPDVTSAKPTTDNYSTFYDHCANSNQLNEAYVERSSGKIGALGVSPPAGYVCRNGAFVLPTPDLTIQKISSNRAASLAFANTDNINFSVEIKNIGADVTSSFAVGVNVNPDAQYSTGFAASSFVQEGIKSGETKNVFIHGSYLIPSNKDFADAVTVTVDSQNNITESNENNNSLNQYITISAGYRYLKVQSTSNSWIAWHEIQALDSSGNVLTPVSCSSSGNYLSTCDFVYPGRGGSWNSGGYTGTITLDYGTNKNITQVRLLPSSSPLLATATHELLGAPDGGSYKSLKIFSGQIQDQSLLMYDLYVK